MKDFIDTINWLGHDSFLIKSEINIYIDPYQLTSAPKADLILITHEHFDHCSVEDVNLIQKEDTIIITEKDSAKKLSGNFRIMKPGDTMQVHNLNISAVSAYNLNKSFHPKAKGWLGFIIEMNGIRLYHAGDTDFIPEMESLDVDIALLPVSGTYVMTAEEAAKAARVFKPKVAIPMHYGDIVGKKSDAEQFRDLLMGEVEVLIFPQSENSL